MERSYRKTGAVCFTVLMVVIGGIIPVAGAISSPRSAQQSTPNATTPNGTVTDSPQPNESVNTTTGMADNATPEASASGSQAPGAQNETVTSVSQSSIEPNDDWENATGAEPGRTVLETLGSNDSDWYVYQLDSGDSIEVSLTAGENTNMSAFLYQAGNMSDRSYVYPGRSTTLTAPLDEGGTYYILIRDESDTNPSSNYAFSLRTVQSNATGAAEGGNGGESGGGSGGIPWIGGFIVIALLAGIVLVIQYSVTDNEQKTER